MLATYSASWAGWRMTTSGFADRAMWFASVAIVASSVSGFAFHCRAANIAESSIAIPSTFGSASTIRRMRSSVSMLPWIVPAISSGFW
ncbi:MAG: hypothetical protein KatS3mg064_0167 [Tepidiforma sp.]|nr:MAG: hypothetical protein KatS3mg064_0167 [Tepidiforma sp.]